MLRHRLYAKKRNDIRSSDRYHHVKLNEEIVSEILIQLQQLTPAVVSMSN